MRPFSSERLRYPVFRNRIQDFDREIRRRWNLNDDADVQQATHTFPAFDPNLVPQENDEELGPMPDGPPDPDYFTPEGYNQYVLAQIKIPLGNEEFIAMVKRLKRNINGKPIGISNDNPLLNTRLNEVELPDGAVEELAANDIAKNFGISATNMDHVPNT